MEKPEKDVNTPEEEETSGSETPDEIHIEFDKLNVSDIVEVYWKGEGKWYEGEVTGLDTDSDLFEIHYKSDNQKLWHSLDDYKVRLML